MVQKTLSLILLVHLDTVTYLDWVKGYTNNLSCIFKNWLHFLVAFFKLEVTIARKVLPHSPRDQRQNAQLAE
jgi:hypothetical protein